MNKLRSFAQLLCGCCLLVVTTTAHAALLAYEPFTNTVGANVIDAGGGFGFSGVWQTNSSMGVATNTAYALNYTDTVGKTLVTSGGAAFFQGLTAANNAMQPIRPFTFSRGTNGADGVTTWISFLIFRGGPTGTLSGNLYGRGANVPQDLGALQKLAIGNSSGAASNTVGLIPQGGGGNLKGATNVFGGATNFVVVRIDHTSGSNNDNSYLFVNPVLGVEPSTNAAGAVSLGNFDFSLDRVRIFAGGQSSAAQPYAEITVDEYRIGETYADVTPFISNAPPTTSGLIITNASLAPNAIVLSGTGGSNGATYFVLAGTNLFTPLTNWSAIGTNTFDANGNFISTNLTTPTMPQQFFRLFTGTPGGGPTGTPPTIATNLTNQTVIVGSNSTFAIGVLGTPTLKYQWYFNTNTLIAVGTSSSFVLTNAQPTNGGVYSVIVTNDYGSVTSALAVLTVSQPLSPGAFFVSPGGSDSNPGTLALPFLTITKGLNTITTSGTVYLRDGAYAQPSKLTLSRIGVTNASIKFWAYPGETPIINSAGNSSDGISLSGRNYHLRGLVVQYAGHNGINISGHSNLVENCTVRSNGNTGLHITGGTSGTTFPSYNVIQNCDAYLNYDPPIGGNADGFSAKWDLGPGNVFRGCRAWWNSDDGWDLWMGNSSILIVDCWAFYNGTNYWGDPQFDGNGQGFKLGGNYIGMPHRLLRSVAFKNESNGVDQNNNEEGQTIDNNTGWANKVRNFNLSHGTNSTPHIVRNNLSFGAPSSDSFRGGSQLSSNSWQVVTSPAVSASDVLSVDESVATSPRNADGSLPYWPFLRPVPAGRLIDKGANIAEPFAGTAPDLGAFENGL